MSRESRAPERRASDAKEMGEVSPSSGNLALLYEGLLTGIVRLQASRQRIPDGESLRKRTKATLQEIERVAVSADYDGQDVRDTHFAVVALLDSVVLHSNDPVRAEWERKSLQEELFGQTDAGVAFFDKLEHFHSRRDSEQLANILEVYLLCLLLGFEGRYSGGSRADLDGIIERARKRIENIRGRSRLLSPAGVLALDPTPSVVAARRSDQFRLVTLVAVIFTILCFAVMKIHLLWASSQVISRLP
jgi:type VI secretion system protein ImpK